MAAASPGAFADVDRDPDALVAIVLNGLDLSLAHGHRQTSAFGDVALAGACAESPGVAQYGLGEIFELRCGIGESIAGFHGAL